MDNNLTKLKIQCIELNITSNKPYVTFLKAIKLLKQKKLLKKP